MATTPRKVSLRDVELARGRFMNRLHAYNLIHPKKIRSRKRPVTKTALNTAETVLSEATAPPADPIMPVQVRDAAARADAIYEQLYGQRATEDTKTNLVLVFAGDEAKRILTFLKAHAIDPRSRP